MYVTGSNCAITGGYVYRGSASPELSGTYFYGDYCSGVLWAAERNGSSWQATQLAFTAPSLASFGEDSAGEIYLASGSTVYRLSGPDLPDPEPGELEFTAAAFDAQEGAGEAVLTVSRLGGSDGFVSVDYATSDGIATAPADYVAAAGTLTWDDGESGVKSFAVSVVDDAEVEDDESLTATLSAPSGGATLGARATAQLTIADNDADQEPCVADEATLCLNGERFEVEVSWRTAEGQSGQGQAEVLGTDAGYFWFFDPDNPEIFVKVLDACFEPFDHFWVFAAGLTDVETSITVVDTASGQVRRYDKELGVGFDPIRDTTAFATCP